MVTHGRNAVLRMVACAALVVACAACSPQAIPRPRQHPAAQRLPRGSAVLRVRVVGPRTPRRCLRYSAPDGGACTVKVSPASLISRRWCATWTRPLSRRRQDTRPETITGQDQPHFRRRQAHHATRCRRQELFARARNLRRRTTIRSLAGPPVATGSFTTANIPLGDDLQRCSPGGREQSRPVDDSDAVAGSHPDDRGSADRARCSSACRWMPKPATSPTAMTARS